MHKYATISAACWLISSLSCQAQVDGPVSIDLQTVRWQLLPPEITSVCVGLDGRTWYTIDPGDWKPSDEELRASLEKKYPERAPQIKAASLALLEPGGRVWFSIRPDEVWGYDGQAWIERKTTAGSKFTGECRTRGEVLNNLANRVVGKRVWLRDDGGIHIFDGSDWTYTALCPSATSQAHSPRFAVSPGGKYAIALTLQSPGQQGLFTNPDVWIWEEGNPQWIKRPIVWGDDQNSVGGFCVTDEGKLWCTQNGTLRIIDLVAIQSIVPRLAELIGQLDDDNAEGRQQAFETLAAVAEQIQPQLVAEQKTAASPEKKRRLDALLDRISTKRFPMLIAGKGTPLGPLLIHSAADLYQDEQERIVFSATISAPDLPRLQNAIVLVDRRGNVERLDTSFVFASSSGARPGIFSDNGRVVWNSGSASSNSAARRLDFATRQLESQTTDMNYTSVMAVDSSGRAFLRGNYFHLEPSAPLGVFSPEYPDRRPSLTGESHAVSSSDHVIASDGKIWAVVKEGLSRYDGRTWELIHPASRGQVAPALSGREGVMLCRNNTGTQYLLFEDNQLIAAAPLRRLISTYPDKFAAAFPPTYTSVQRNYRLCITSDTHKNIWQLEQNSVAVFNGEDWIAGPDSPRLMRGLPNSLGSNFMTAVGDGSRVYFSTSLAVVEEGKIVSSPAPQCLLPPEMAIGLRDREGAFWLPAYVTLRPGDNNRQREHYTIRLGAQKPLEEFKNNAWPFLVDQSGNVWLAKMGQTSPPSPRCHLWVWRDGKIVQEVQVPLAQDMRGILSDKPGSVYIWTGLGLHHFIAESSDDSGHYTLKQTYSLPQLRLNGNSISCTYSPLLGLVIPTQSRNLTIIPLPTE